jgi:N-acetylglutamate synthase-like GNAT family acetyltransferase
LGAKSTVLPAGLKLRGAEAVDQDVITRMVTQARLNPMGLDWRRFILIEAQDGEVIACGQVKPHRDGSRELASLVVEEQWRGMGLGSAILSEFMQDYEPPLYLMCRSTLVSYYTRFGFRELTPEMEQPPYFKRIRRLFGKLVDWMAGDGSYLAIMEWSG